MPLDRLTSLPADSGSTGKSFYGVADGGDGRLTMVSDTFRFIPHLVRQVRGIARRRADRHELERLSDDMLRDLGLRRAFDGTIVVPPGKRR